MKFGRRETILTFSVFQDIIKAIRNVRAEKSVKPNQRIPAIFVAGDFTSEVIRQSNSLIKLASLDKNAVNFHVSLSEKPKDTITLVVSSVNIPPSSRSG